MYSSALKGTLHLFEKKEFLAFGKEKSKKVKKKNEKEKRKTVILASDTFPIRGISWQNGDVKFSTIFILEKKKNHFLSHIQCKLDSSTKLQKA